MNEPQLADLLENYLDAFLEGEEVAEAPAEIAQLLSVAQELADIAPMPRPEFGAALKASLLNPAIPPGDGGASGLPGTTWGSGKVLLMAVAGMAIVAITVAVLFSLVRRGDDGSEVQEEPTAINRPALEEVAPTTPPISLPPMLTPTSTVAPTATSTAEPVVPTATATMIIDTLPPITVTIEPAAEPTLPPVDLVPGLAPPESDGGGDGGNGGNGGNGGGGGDDGGGGDRNRGHGNDPGRRDPDNPGKKP